MFNHVTIDKFNKLTLSTFLKDFNLICRSSKDGFWNLMAAILDLKIRFQNLVCC